MGSGMMGRPGQTNGEQGVQEDARGSRSGKLIEESLKASLKISVLC